MITGRVKGPRRLLLLLLGAAALSPALLFATPVTYHWAPPTTGSPVSCYHVTVASPWGRVIETFIVTVASLTFDDHDSPHRIYVIAEDASHRYSVRSVVSDLYVPECWRSVFWEIADRAHLAPLTFIVYWALVLLSRWVD